jgi:palmitoyltransferase ZDHHC6
VFSSALHAELTVSDPPEAWPPRDPNEEDYTDPDHEFKLPESPWTFENSSFNPELRPGNGTARRRRSNRGEVANVPPYHPDFDEDVQPSRYDDSSSSDDEVYRSGATRIRRGSEGVEVLPVNRAEMMQRYVQEVATEEGRYQRYVPEPASESEGEDDYVPLAQLHPYSTPSWSILYAQSCSRNIIIAID